MKKILCLSTLILSATLIQANAGEQGQNLEQFLAGTKKYFEKQGNTWGPAQDKYFKKRFTQLDADGNGKVTKKERANAKKKK